VSKLLATDHISITGNPSVFIYALSMTILVIPALIRLHALLSRTDFHFLWLLLHPI
jgi:hypothetical protein